MRPCSEILVENINERNGTAKITIDGTVIRLVISWASSSKQQLSHQLVISVVGISVITSSRTRFPDSQTIRLIGVPYL